MINKITLSGTVSATLSKNNITFKEETIVRIKDKELIAYTKSNNINVFEDISFIGSSITIGGKPFHQALGEAVTQVIDNSGINEKNNTDNEKKGVLEFDLSKLDVKIKKINLAGQSTISFENDISLNKLKKINTSGQSSITIEEQSLRDLVIECSGQSSVYLSLIIMEELDITCSGQSRVEGHKVTYEEIEENISGQSRININ